MNQIREAFQDVADEITPAGPPLELTMRRGRRLRNRRLTVAAGATAGAAAAAVGLAFGVPALSSPGGAPAPAVAAAPAGAAVVSVRPVLLETVPGSTTAAGDASLVNQATRQLFSRLVCRPGPNAVSVDSSWENSVGWTRGQWDNPGGQVVSCDASGGKYVLGPAVFTGADITRVTVGRVPKGTQWVVGLTLDSKASAAFGRLTTKQARDYYPASQRDDVNDAVLAQSAFLLDGNVVQAPETVGPVTSGPYLVQGPQPDGFTHAQAEALAARL